MQLRGGNVVLRCGVLVIAWLVASCTHHDVAGPTVPVPSVVTLAVGEHVMLTPDRVELGFRRVDGDSRCPKSVQCIWVGKAGVQLWLLQATHPDSVFVGIGMEGEAPASAESLGYRITATKLDPYPQRPGPIPQPSYRVTLRIEKSGG